MSTSFACWASSPTWLWWGRKTCSDDASRTNHFPVESEPRERNRSPEANPDDISEDDSRRCLAGRSLVRSASENRRPREVELRRIPGILPGPVGTTPDEAPGNDRGRRRGAQGENAGPWEFLL